jgi:Rap1a immunity proteins
MLTPVKIRALELLKQLIPADRKCAIGTSPMTLAKAAQVFVKNKTVPTVVALSLAFFEVAASTRNLDAQEWDQQKLGFFSGNDVHSWCQSTPSIALGYTAGIMDQSARTFTDLSFQRGHSPEVDAAISWEKEMIFGYCEPQHVTAQQVTDVFCAYLRDKPERRAAPAAILFKEAMQRVWPC